MIITFDEKAMAQAQAVLSACPKRVKFAASAAINRTVTKLRAQVSKQIVKNYFIHARDVKATITTKRANSNSLRGVVASTGAPLLITHFKLNPDPKKQIAANKLSSAGGPHRRRRRKPMTVRVKRGSPSATVPGLFVQQSSRSGYAGPMQRYLRTRYPLRIPYGPSVPQMFGNPNVLEELAPEAEEFLNERFLHEVEVQLGKM